MNISADHLSGEDYGRQRDIYTQMRGSEPGPTLLYVTPEKVSNREQLILDFLVWDPDPACCYSAKDGSRISLCIT
jgi:hypothetical protein